MQYDPLLIVTDETRATACAYLESRGYNAAELAIMTTVAVANAYHATPDDPSSEIHLATARAVLMTLATMANRDAPKPPPVPRAMSHYRLPLVLQIASLGHPVMMVGPAGCGKTKIGEQVAESLEQSCYITSTVSEPHELVGFIDGYGQYHPTPFRTAFEHGGVWIADEIDAWEARALLVANSAFANGFCQFPDNVLPIKRHPDFQMIATANTYGTGADRMYVGRNELDGASLDRFAMIEIDYDIELERMFAGSRDDWLEHVWNIRKKVNELKIRHIVSSRAIIMGSAALKSGVEWSDCETLYLFKGISKRDKDKL